MNRWLRVLLALAVTIVSTAIDLKLFGKIPFSGTLFVADALLFLPICILLLPIALYFERLDIRRSLFLVCCGAMVGPTIIIFEIVFHLVHADHLPYPRLGWFIREFSYLTVGTGFACSVYALICGGAERRSLASNHQHDR